MLGVEFGVSRQRIWAIVRKGRGYWQGRSGRAGRPARAELPEEYMEQLKKIARHE